MVAVTTVPKLIMRLIIWGTLLYLAYWQTVISLNTL